MAQQALIKVFVLTKYEDGCDGYVNVSVSFSELEASAWRGANSLNSFEVFEVPACLLPA